MAIAENASRLSSFDALNVTYWLPAKMGDFLGGKIGKVSSDRARDNCLATIEKCVLAQRLAVSNCLGHTVQQTLDVKGLTVTNSEKAVITDLEVLTIEITTSYRFDRYWLTLLAENKLLTYRYNDEYRVLARVLRIEETNDRRYIKVVLEIVKTL